MKLINPPELMKPVGGYSHGVAAGNMVFDAGQTGIDANMQLPGDGGMAAQTRQAIAIIGSSAKGPE